jgi:hypothetical protein
MICNVQIVACIYKKSSYPYLSKTKDDTKLKKNYKKQEFYLCRQCGSFHSDQNDKLVLYLTILMKLA